MGLASKRHHYNILHQWLNNSMSLDSYKNKYSLIDRLYTCSNIYKTKRRLFQSSLLYITHVMGYDPTCAHNQFDNMVMEKWEKNVFKFTGDIS